MRNPDLFAEFSQCRKGHPPRPKGKRCPECQQAIRARYYSHTVKPRLKKKQKNRDHKRSGTQLWIHWARKTFELYLQCWEYQDGYVLPKSSLSKLQTVRDLCQLLADMTADQARYDYYKKQMSPQVFKLEQQLEKKKKRWKDC